MRSTKTLRVVVAVNHVGCFGSLGSRRIKVLAVADVSVLWRDTLFELLQQHEHASVLKQAALDAQLKPWTSAMTAVTIESFSAMGLRAAARGNPLDLLPVSRHEYLSLDVMAFPGNGAGWCLPAAIVELENSLDDRMVAYSLWKVLCVRAKLRAVVCYRRETDAAATLVRLLRDQLIAMMPIETRISLDGETLVVVGTRGEVATFPYGFFKWWRLDANTG